MLQKTTVGALIMTKGSNKISYFSLFRIDLFFKWLRYEVTFFYLRKQIRLLLKNVTFREELIIALIAEILKKLFKLFKSVVLRSYNLKTSCKNIDTFILSLFLSWYFPISFKIKFVSGRENISLLLNPLKRQFNLQIEKIAVAM